MPTQQFIDTAFKPRSMQQLADCQAVIARYQAQGLRLTLRQLYYQLVTQNIIPNSERAYKNLGSLISKGRLAGVIDWSAIQDRIRVPWSMPDFEDPQDLMEWALQMYRLARWEGQDDYVELWVEKDALAGVLQPLARQHHVTLMVNRGYSSQSAMYGAHQRFKAAWADGRTCTILYLGDLDPSGEDMVRDIQERLNDVMGAVVEVKKLAITPDQVAQYNPPPNPAKMTDSRAARFVEEHGRDSYEVDALPPDVLTDIINDAFDEYIDQDSLDRVLALEDEDKAAIRRLIDQVMRDRNGSPDGDTDDSPDPSEE